MKRPNLIIDVGMHRGEDTDFYLAKGFDVVAVEANPTLAAEARTRLAAEVLSGRLRIIEGAIAATAETQRLAVADDFTIWTTVSNDFMRSKQERGVVYRHIDVTGLRFADIIAGVGVPYYLKIDIEGHDMLCVEALHDFGERPDYISVESTVCVGDVPFELVFDELAQLWRLGYRAFKYLDQSRNPRQRCPYPPLEGTYVDTTFHADSSGPFGEETPRRWLSIDQAVLYARWLRWHHRLVGSGGRWSQAKPALAYRRISSTLLHRRPAGWYEWYDLHARLKPVDTGGR